MSISKIFAAEGITGTLIVVSSDNERLYVHDRKRAETRFSPASTFKIINTLIGLETGVVTSRNSQFKWDGTDRGLSTWNKDQTLETAFKVSCVWCYQELARAVGSDTYSSELSRIGYGNGRVGNHVDQFWLNGDLQVSAAEQVGILRSIHDYSIGFHRATVDELKAIMLEEQSGDYALYAKTGWTGAKLHVGWYVGYVETADETWFFAMNMRMGSADQAPLRKDLTIRSLRALGIL